MGADRPDKLTRVYRPRKDEQRALPRRDWIDAQLFAMPTAQSGTDLGSTGLPAFWQRIATVALKVVRFIAIVLTALALVPAGAHLFALLNKIGLVQEQYFIVQSIYRGWALFGVILIPAMLVNLLLAVMLRGRTAQFTLALLASICLGATLVVFFIWTYPANVATNNWTTVPENWEQLRRQWEYSHASNALITFVAFCSVTLSVLIEPQTK
jgi:hypothetical protein